MNLNFSIIIIGFNSLATLKELLPSIKQLNITNIKLEVVYVDDGSKDDSYSYFKSYKFPFTTIPVQLHFNKGRVHATNIGIKHATGDWLIFIQSNMIVTPNLLQHYAKAIQTKNNLIFTGRIKYQSSDVVFENYLNHFKRGINGYQEFDTVHFSHLLFGNCIINKTVFKQVKLNLKLGTYGGEELDFAYQAIQKFPNTILAYPKALVIRIQFPRLTTHCLRLEEYGGGNLSILSPLLQQQVIKFPKLLLNIPYGLQWIITFCYYLGKKAYQIPCFSGQIIKIVLGLAILRGYYNKAK